MSQDWYQTDANGIITLASGLSTRDVGVLSCLCRSCTRHTAVLTEVTMDRASPSSLSYGAHDPYALPPSPPPPEVRCKLECASCLVSMELGPLPLHVHPQDAMQDIVHGKLSWPIQTLYRQPPVTFPQPAQLAQPFAMSITKAMAQMLKAHQDQVRAVQQRELKKAQSPPPPVGPPPAVQGSLIGYRAWKLNTNRWQLTGSGSNIPWVFDVNEASCRVKAHPAPAEHCQCGLYSLARFSDGASWWRGAGLIKGAVETWSDVDDDGYDRMFLHRTGMRAQYAKVILLAVDDEQPRVQQALVRAFAREFGADTCKVAHLEDAAKEHGQLVPDDLLHWAAASDAVQPPAKYLE